MYLQIAYKNEIFMLDVGEMTRDTAKSLLAAFVPEARLVAVYLALEHREDRDITEVYAFLYPRRFEAAQVLERIAKLPKDLVLTTVSEFKKLSADGPHDPFATMIERDVVRNLEA